MAKNKGPSLEIHAFRALKFDVRIAEYNMINGSKRSRNTKYQNLNDRECLTISSAQIDIFNAKFSCSIAATNSLNYFCLIESTLNS